MSDPTPVILVTAGVLAAFATGALAGYVARGRANRGELQAAGELVSMLNSAEVRDDLAQVGPISGEHPEIPSPDLYSVVTQSTVSPRPIAMTGRRDLAAQDREQAEIYDWATAEDDTTLPRSVPDGVYKRRLT